MATTTNPPDTWDFESVLQYIDAHRRNTRALTKLEREAIWARDGRQCSICGDALPLAELHVDHIIPWHLGGRTTTANLRATHGRCNHAAASELRRQASPQERELYRASQALRRRSDRPCRQCGATMPNVLLAQQFCGPACRKRAERQRRHAESRPAPATPAAPEEP